MTTHFQSHAQHGARPPRAQRVAELLRQEISQMMLQDIKDPRVRMASVSAVHLSPDLRSARVLVSAVGEEAERKAVIRGLHHAAGYLRGELGHRLESLKVVPRLRFELDESIAYSVHISTMLRELAPEESAEATPAGQVGGELEGGSPLEPGGDPGGGFAVDR